MTKTLRIHRLAEDELGNAALWYEAKQSGLGVALLDLVDKAIDNLTSGVAPTSPVPGVKIVSVRRILLRRYPYSIVLYENRDETLIIAFAHNRQRPGYWRARKFE